MVENIEELAARIRPVVRYKMGNQDCPFRLVQDYGGFPWYVWADGINTEFLSKPLPMQPAELEKLAEIQTNHPAGYCFSFNPTVGEVLSQIPEDYLSQAAAFEIQDGEVGRLNLTEAGFAVTTILYKKKN